MFDYATVKQVLTDHQTFSSRIPASPFSFIFTDPPEHRRLRNVISRAFTPDMIAALEPSIRQISQELFDGAAETDSMDFARDISGPLAMKVIAGIIGIPQEDWSRYRTWNDAILGLTFTRSGTERAERAMRDFRQATQEMSAYLEDMIAERRKRSQDDLLTRLIAAEVDGESLTHAEILAFFQLLMFAGQETTTNLLNNAVLCFLECPEAWKRLGGEPELLAGAIEEVLRFRSPFQWAMRTPTRDVEIHGQVIPKGALVLPMIGSANRDPAAFVDPNRFDITRSPNPHIAFGHGIHFCLGAPLSRLEARVALSDLLNRVASFEYAGGDPWQPRPGLMVYGPANLPITLRMRELH